MKRKEKLIGAGVILVLFTALFLVLSLGFGLFSIVANSHQHNAYGQSWTVTSNWGDNQNRQCRQVITDGSVDQSNATSGTISAQVTTTNDRTICDYREGITFSLNDLDLTQYSKVVIHRSGSISVSTKANAYTASTSIKGVGDNPTGNPGTQQTINNNGQLSVGRASYGSLGLGDITIVRSGGQTILYANPEAPSGYVLPGDEPYQFSTTISGASDGTVQANIAITGIELTPLPVTATTPPVLPSGPVVNAIPNLTSPPSPAVAMTWWESFKNTISNVFSHVKGWFS